MSRPSLPSSIRALLAASALALLVGPLAAAPAGAVTRSFTYDCELPGATSVVSTGVTVDVSLPATAPPSGVLTRDVRVTLRPSSGWYAALRTIGARTARGSIALPIVVRSGIFGSTTTARAEVTGSFVDLDGTLVGDVGGTAAGTQIQVGSDGGTVVVGSTVEGELRIFAPDGRDITPSTGSVVSCTIRDLQLSQLGTIARSSSQPVSFTFAGAARTPTLTRGNTGVSGAFEGGFAPLTSSIDGSLDLADASATLLGRNALPVQAVLGFAQQGTASGSFDGTTLRITSTQQITVKSARVFGISLNYGAGCRVATATRIPLAGPFDPTTGGQLTAAFSLGDLVDCGFLDYLVDPATTGDGQLVVQASGLA